MAVRECRWTGRETPRAVWDRHTDECDDDRCRGCQPCTKAHCVVCGIEHVDEQTCPSCIGTTRTDLAEIRRMYHALPLHAVEGGNDGHLESSRPIPGGEAMVMLAPGSGHGYAEYERKGEAIPTELLLATWEDDWREVRSGETALELASVDAAVKYLDANLDWAAQQHPAFDSFAEEIREHRAHLEDVLHDGERIDTGAPCKVCGRPLERNYGAQAKDDSWWCDRCKVLIRPDEYAENVARESRQYAKWLPAAEMAEEHRIPRGTLSSWASDGKVRKRRDTNLGRVVYNVEDAVTRRDQLAMRDTARDVS